MAITSFTSEYDEIKNYREALLDRLAELVIANHKKLTNLDSIKSSQKITKDGIIQSGGRTVNDERIVLFRSDVTANDTDSPYIEQLLNIFSEYGNTDEANYGVPVGLIQLNFIQVDGSPQTTIPVLSAPGIPGIELPDVGNFFNDNVSQFIDISPEKQTFHKDKIKEYLNTNLQEILPKNFAIIKKINNWFQEYDLLKNHIEPGITPLFKSSRELFEPDDEKLTYLVRNAVDLLYPQTHPIYASQNYYNTENALIQLDYDLKSDSQRLKDIINLQSVRSISKDKIIKIITDRIIPLLTEKYTAQLTEEGIGASFSQYQLEQIVLAIRTGNYSNILGNLVYSQNWEEVDVSSFANDYTISNTVASEEGVVSQDFHLYKGIAIACKPNQYQSNSTWGLKNQYSGIIETEFNLNYNSWLNGHTHRHFFGERHFWTTFHSVGTADGHFTTSPTSFKVTHPNGTEYSITVGSEYKTSMDKISAIASITRLSGQTGTTPPSTNNITTPPVGYNPSNGWSYNNQIDFNGTTWKYNYNWGFHTRQTSATDIDGHSTQENNPACFLAYIGSDLTRFASSGANLSGGLAVILWMGDKWVYDRGNNSLKENYDFKPNYEDFIICELSTTHFQTEFAIHWIGSTESFATDTIPNVGTPSYFMGNRKTGTGNYIAGGGRGGLWSGYYRRRFQAKGITEKWRDHGEPSGTWGLVDVSFPQSPKPGDESETSQVLRMTVNDRIDNQNIAANYSNQWQGARKYFNYVGHDNDSAISELTAGQTYKMFFTLRTSRPNIKWEVKIGDYRNGHEEPIWESKISEVSTDTEWKVYQLSSVTPIKRGSEPATNRFSEYNYPEKNTIAQICVGLKPALFSIENPSNTEGTTKSAIENAVDEFIEIENIEIYGDNILTNE